MTLVRTSKDLFPSFSSLFEDLAIRHSDGPRSNTIPANTTLPKVNIREDENGFVVEVAAPGMRKEDFSVQLDHDLLTVSSERSEEHQADEKIRYSRREFAFRPFRRSFALPGSADGEQISAVYERGILQINIPKKEEARPRPPKAIRIS